MDHQHRKGNQTKLIRQSTDTLYLTLPIPHRVSISAVTLPTPPIPTTATEKSLIFYNEHTKTHKPFLHQSLVQTFATV